MQIDVRTAYMSSTPSDLSPAPDNNHEAMQVKSPMEADPHRTKFA